LAPNAVAMNIAREAVVNNWTVQVDTCSMNPQTFAVGKKLTSETWLAANMSYDPEKLVVLLSSGIDAVGASAPTRKLTLDLVGALPSTAQIQNRAWIGAMLIGPLLLSILASGGIGSAVIGS